MLGMQTVHHPAFSDGHKLLQVLWYPDVCGYWPKEHPGGPDKGCEAPQVSWGEFNLQLQWKADSFKVRLVLGQSVGLSRLQAGVRVMTMLEIMTVGDRKGFHPRKVKQFPQSHIVSDRIEIFNPDTSCGI